MNQIIFDLQKKLADAKRGSKKALVGKAAQSLGWTVRSVYLALQDAGGTAAKPRKIRSDAGKTSVRPEYIHAVAGMVLASTSKKGKKRMSAALASEIVNAQALDADLLHIDQETGEIITPKIANVLRVAKTMGCHPEQLKRPSPVTEMRSKHPNHVWQIDASVCALFYLPSGGAHVINEAKFYKNKPQNLKQIEPHRVTRYVVHDHYSGAIFVHYALGYEDTEGVVETLLQAMQKRAPNDLLYGVPEKLMMDCGSANRSQQINNLLMALKIEAIERNPENPRANGGVEKAQDLVEAQIESRLRFLKITDIQELNKVSSNIRIAWMAKKRHSRHGMTRNACWMLIKADQLRLAPKLEVCRELVVSNQYEPRVLPNLTIKINNKTIGSHEYDVSRIPTVMQGERLKVRFNAYRAPDIDVILLDQQGQTALVTLSPITRDTAGFRTDAPILGESYAAKPKTLIEQNKEKITKQVWGDQVPHERGAVAQGVDALADVKKTNKKVTYLSPKADQKLAEKITDEVATNHAPLVITTLTSTATPPRKISRKLDFFIGMEAIMQAIEPIEWQGEHFAWLDENYADGFDEIDTEAIAIKLLRATTHPDFGIKNNPFRVA